MPGHQWNNGLDCIAFDEEAFRLAERAHPDDPGFQGTIYERRMHDRYRFAAAYAAGRDVLDAACGTCWGWIHLGNARSIAGFDVSVDALHEAARLGFGRRLAAADMERLPFPQASFDLVVCMEAIEHIQPSSAEAFLAECRRILRPGGLIVLSTPLRSASRHSGNPWHLIEYTEEEVRGLLEAQFECIESRVDTEDEPPVFLYAGSLRPERRPGAVRWSACQIQPRAEEWLAGITGPGGFRFAPECPVTVTSTAIGVLLGEGLGALDRQPVARQALAETIQSAQDPDSGLFVEPLSPGVRLEGELHSEEYFHWMTTYFALQALDALGEKPRYALHFLDSFPDRESVRNWLESLDWSNPWRESNRVMQFLAGLLFRLQWGNDPAAAERYHDVLDWLDEQQDPRTGLWGVKQGASLLNAVAGAYHFVPFYRYARRPVRGWSKIVDACLELQQEDGLFGPAPGGGACEDLDVIDLLCNASRATGRLEPEIRQALTRAFWAIWNMQLPEGSFPYACAEGGARYNFSSWPATSARVNGGDVWATWFRLCALHTIRSLLGDDLPEIGAWTFRRMPALGFHLQDTAIPEDAPLAHRPIWFRPLAAPPPPEAPRVSVVVTCYNLGLYLYESLASVSSQTLREVETVVVDDGSTDPYTVARLDALAEDGWRVIRTENRGLPAARNLGIRHTRAPFICCLDADDRLRPAYLEKAAAALDANPRAGFISCFYDLFDEAEGACRYPRPGLPRMLARNEAAVSSVFRREAWTDAGGYCESLPAMQDWDLWISILEKGWQGGLLPEALFDYRVRAGSMYSQTRKPANYARISAMIYARHEELYRRYLNDLVRLKSLFFAQNVEYISRQEEAFRRALREMRRQAAMRRQQPAAAPGGAPAEDEKKQPPIPPSLAATVLWSLGQALRWRGLKNLWLLARALLSRELRELWYGYFDPFSYCDQRPDVARSRIHASVHYALAGAWEDVDASPEFSTALYWRRHPDVREAGLNPLLHFLHYGRHEGRIAIPVRVPSRPHEFPRECFSEGSSTAEPLVSVVIPCFNLGRYAEEALASALRQTLAGIEIILVEGGSTDGETAERVRRLARAGLPGVRVLFRDKPSLAGDNRNFGIRHARGRYVCCLDADDLLEPSYLETAIFAAEFGAFDFVYPSVQEFGAGAARWITQDPRWPDIVRENSVSTVALFRREVWEKLEGFRDWGVGSQHVAEDWDFWIRAVAAGYRGKALSGVLMHYRIRPDSLSRRDTGGQYQLAGRMAKVHSNLALRKPPAAGPRPVSGRLKWECFDAPREPTVMLVIPFFTIGGAERIFLSLFKEWRRRKTRIVVVTTLRLAPHVPNRIDQVRGFTPHVYELPELFAGSEDLQAGFLYFLLRRYKPDLIFTAGSDFFYRFLPAVRRHFPGIRVIDQLFNDQVHLPMNRVCAPYIDCTSVPGDRFARRLVEEFGESPDRVAVVRQCIRLPRPTGPRPPAGWPAEFTGKPVAGFFGRISPEKAPVDFLRIARKIVARMPEARFVMAGDGPDLADVRKQIRKMGLGGIVHAGGFVGEVHGWMDACDIVILCSKIDGMPLAVLEAQALGKPVVASRVGSVPEMIVDGETGALCEPGDIDAFASAALRLLRDSELRRRMGEAGRDRIHREFREEIMIEQYFRLFERIAGSGKDQAASETSRP